MPVKLGINGMGRIGRRILRLAQGDPDLQVVQVNDLGDAKTLAHLLKYDSVHGTFPGEVSARQQSLQWGDQEILVTQEREPGKIPWERSGAQIVLECTGKFRDRVQCEQHLRGEVKKVILSAPGQGVDLTLVLGVNHRQYRSEVHRVVSNASCTTNCLAPLAMILDEALQIQYGTMTTIHSYTNDQALLDFPHKDLRRARAGALSQVPTSTGAAHAIGEVLPHLAGKIEGMSIRVPTANVSLVDLVVHVAQPTTLEAVHRLFETAAQGPLRGIIELSHEPLVSCDYNGSRFSAVLDALSTQVLAGRLVKVLAWYDNETGFSQRMIDLAKLLN